jgi:hypothetical protein
VWEKKNRSRVLLCCLCQIGKAVGSRPVYVCCVSPKHFRSSVMESEREHDCTVLVLSLARNDVNVFVRCRSGSL